MSVDLPAALSPSKAKVSPGITSKLTPCRARIAPKLFQISTSSTSACPFSFRGYLIC